MKLAMYMAIQAQRSGGPGVLKPVFKKVEQPGRGQVRIDFLACAVCAPDVTMRRGDALWSGTFLGQKFPVVPGYSLIGRVEALGADVRNVSIGDLVGVLTVTGSYSEKLIWRADRLIPVPQSVDPVSAAPVVLNYIVAYHVMFRKARCKAAKRALIIGGSGGIGSALVQLCNIAGVEACALSSKKGYMDSLGANSIDYRKEGFSYEIIRQYPDKFDYVFAGHLSGEYLSLAERVLKKSGILVAFAEPPSRKFLKCMLRKMFYWKLNPFKPRFSVYGTSSYFLFGQKKYYEDWARLFSLVDSGKLCPPVDQFFPLSEAGNANALLEKGTVCGNIVLVSPELLADHQKKDNL